MAFSWQNTEHQAVRELGWSLFSPSILNLSLPPDTKPWYPPCDLEAQRLLLDLKKNPRPLESHLASTDDKRLGSRFELLWDYFLRQHSNYRVHTRNRQIFDTNRTIGAVDFIIEDLTGEKTIHLELAVKFYLYVPESPNTALAKWVGPNPTDNLSIKCQRLLEHQLPLSAQPQSIDSFKKDAIPLPEHRVANVKGYLFSPMDSFVTPGSPISVKFPHGYWLKNKELGKLKRNFPDGNWQILNKEDWLDPAPFSKYQTTYSTVDLIEELKLQQRPRQVVRKSDANRYFVMPDSWPK